MSDSDADDAPTKEEEIAELKDDLRRSIMWRDRYRAPVSWDEINRRAKNRVAVRAGGLLAVIVGVAGFVATVWLSLPSITPVAIMLACGLLVYGAACLWEMWFARESKPAWRAERAREFEIEIGEIRNELFRLGVKSDPSAGNGRRHPERL